MDMISVSSTSLAAFGYEPESMELKIVFNRSGREYTYTDVPESVYAGLRDAESKGRYFTQHIRNNYAF